MYGKYYEKKEIYVWKIIYCVVLLWDLEDILGKILVKFISSGKFILWIW